jgi:hypothetical protein
VLCQQLLLLLYQLNGKALFLSAGSNCVTINASWNILQFVAGRKIDLQSYQVSMFEGFNSGKRIVPNQTKQA